MAKSSLKAYILWLFFGCLGIHHFYLNRTFQGVIWLSTFGGFTFGWLADIFRIPEYVAAANEEPPYMERLGLEMRHSKKPPLCSYLIRILWLIIVGSIFRSYMYMLLPDSMPAVVYCVLIPIGNIIGFYLVMNIGRMECSLKDCVRYAYLGQVVEWYVSKNVTHPGMFSIHLPSVILFLFSRKWNKQPIKTSFYHKAKWYIGTCIVLSAVVTCGAYFHLKIEVDGEIIYLRDGVKNFRNSPAWNEFKSIMSEFWTDYQSNGWENASHKFYQRADLEGESHALEIMGLQEGCTTSEIKKRFREMSMKWHPDKHPGDTKQVAQDKFIEMENARETLLKIAARRERKRY